MKTRWKILIGLAAALGIVFVTAVAHHFQLKAAVNRYRAELKAKGELIELAAVLPPSLSKEKNAAQFFTNAVFALNTNQGVLWSNQPPVMRMVSPGKAMVGWMQPFICDYPGGGASNSWAEIDAALADEERGLSLLRKLPDQPVFDFRLNYDGGFTKMKFSPLAPAKQATMRLEASTSANLRHKNTQTAGRDIQAILAITQGFSHDRILISELVRLALLQIAIASTWEFLQSTNVTVDELDALQSGWEKTEIIQPFERAILVESAVGAIELEAMRTNGLQTYIQPVKELGLIETEKGLMADLKVKYKCFMWRWWWSYPDQLRSIRAEQALLQATRQMQTNQSFYSANSELEKQIESLGIQPDSDDSFWFGDPVKADFRFILSSSVVVFERAFNKVAKTETARQTTITAIALKRFQLKRGNYPAHLAELTPEFLASVPLDSIDGQLLRYRRNADGTFLLYSIGENGKDDGGNPSLEDNAKSKSLQWQNANALDWVWPQPATEAEIQKYYEEQANKPK